MILYPSAGEDKFRYACVCCGEPINFREASAKGFSLEGRTYAIDFGGCVGCLKRIVLFGEEEERLPKNGIHSPQDEGTFTPTIHVVKRSK